MMIIERIRQEYEQVSQNSENLQDVSRYHKDLTEPMMVLRTPLVREISKRVYDESIKGLSKSEVFEQCEALLRAGYTTIPFEWAFRVKRGYTLEDFDRFETWLRRYVQDWGACDDLCTHALGYHLMAFPEILPRVVAWSKEEGRWLKRASAVTLILPLRKGKYLTEAVEVADTLMMDDDDLVQKGYGWMLKEASKAFPDAVFDYVMTHRHHMPRTALRYAIEKFPEEKRREAMDRD